MEDPAFVRAVQAGQGAFRKGDLLNVRLQTRQWVEGTDLKAEFAIVKVHNHEAGPRNLPLLPDNEQS